jgi:cytoskeletal protein CcmA (bactofilin family)
MSWMKNDSKDPQNTRPTTSTTSTTSNTRTAAPSSSDSLPPRPVNVATKAVNLGKSIKVCGELSGNEDLVIDCEVEGSIDLKNHTLTIGVNAKIKADVVAKAVIVVGEMKGNITAHDRVEIVNKGTMHGDINSPRVALADGATFKGSVDMEVSSSSSSRAATELKAAVTPASSDEMDQRPN